MSDPRDVSASLSQPPVVIYRAHVPGFWNPGDWAVMARQLLGARELVWRLFVRDFRARFRQSIAGVLWAVISPLVVTGAFVLLESSGMLNVESSRVPYPIYVLLGLCIWQVFAGTVGACTRTLAESGDMIRRIQFSREALVLSASGHVCVDVVIRLVLLALLCVVYGYVPTWTAIFLPLIMLPLLILSLGLGLILAAAAVVVRDVIHLVTLGLTYLLLLTPAMYPMPSSGPLATIMRYNPLTPLIRAGQDVVLHGGLMQPGTYLAVSAACVLVALVSWRLFYMAQPQLAERA